MTWPTAADIREAFPEFEIVLADSGYWQATLTGGEKCQRIVAGTLARLAEALNELVSRRGRFTVTGNRTATIIGGIATALAAAAGLSGCSSGAPAWCGQPVTASVGYSGAPAQALTVDGQHASHLVADVEGAAVSGDLAGGGYITETLSVPRDYPRGLRSYASRFSASRNDAVMLAGFQAAWLADYQKACKP